MNPEDRKSGLIEVDCPCCGAKLRIDPGLGKTIFHQAPPRRSSAPDLDQARQVLEEQARQRDAMFAKSADAEKSKSQLLERKFEDALERAKDQPASRPLRDFDLD